MLFIKVACFITSTVFRAEKLNLGQFSGNVETSKLQYEYDMWTFTRQGGGSEKSYVCCIVGVGSSALLILKVKIYSTSDWPIWELWFAT